MENNEKKENRGGKRPNAGRKKIDNEPKRTITFSVPEGIAERIKEVVRKEVAEYRKQRKV